MDKEWMARQLPEVPPSGYEEWIVREGCDDLRAELMIFSAEREKIYPPMEMEVTPDTPRKPRTIWQTRCTCTECGEDFVTQHAGAGCFLMYMGEDGCTYPVDPTGTGEPIADEIEDYGYDNSYLEMSDGDGMACPNCGANVTVIHRNKLRGSRTKQTLGITIQNVWNYTCVIYWLTAKRIYDDGTYDLETYPRDAYVIGERGGITRYRHTAGSEGGFTREYRIDHWKPMADASVDSGTMLYHSWQAINNQVCGHWVWKHLPWMAGTTGEKTGLDEYIRQGGQWPVAYLKIWQKHRNVENLVRAGWWKLIEQNITQYQNYDQRDINTNISYVDFSRNKPHEMLMMKRADFRAIAQTRTAWDMDTFNEWADYHLSGGQCSALEFEKYYRTFRHSGVAALSALREDDDTIDFPRLAAYLDKQGIPHDEAQLLYDARQMAEQLHPDRELSPAELWPRRLRVMHDELSRMQAVMQDEKKSRELDAGFIQIRETFGALEWTDGELRILLPLRNEDLILEGHTLNHCVGRYGNGHVEGRSVIFFVRKHRRPERSYYTLDINMSGSVPKEVQLHGYGNERHGPNNQYTHSIPKKVRDFIDRWKKEVLMPWWISRENADIKEKTA